MNGTVKTALQMLLVFAVIWALAWFTGKSASISVPGYYARVGKRRGRCGGRRRPRNYGQTVTGMAGDYINTAAPVGLPAGQPYSIFA